MTTITTAKAREIAHYMNTTVHDIRALAISRGVTIDDTPVDDTETDAEEQEAAMQDDLEQRVARAIYAELGVQDSGEAWELPDSLKAPWLDQGETDMAAIARAITPMVLEEAAKVADNEAAAWVYDNEGSHGARQASSYIATAIRALGAKP
jgi:hypothetical protein